MILNASHCNRPDSRYIYGTTPINENPSVQLDLPPSVDQQLISWSNHVIGCDWNTIDRGEGSWNLPKEVVPKQGQLVADRTGYELLELSWFFLLDGRNRLHPNALLGNCFCRTLRARDLELIRDAPHRAWQLFRLLYPSASRLHGILGAIGADASSWSVHFWI
jgi:hypothetical protein